MTVKELAEFCGKTERTIRNWIKNAQGKNFLTNGKKFLTNGHETDLTIDEVEKILQCSSLSNYTVSILMKNAREKQSAEVTTQSAEVSTLTKKDIEMISLIVSTTVARTMEHLSSRVDYIENRIQERQALLPPPEIDSRTNITRLVRSYVDRTNIPYSRAWSELYKEFGYRTHTNPVQCAKNRGVSVIDYIEQEGQIELLESIAMEVL